AAQAAYLVAQQIYSEANEANESKKISSVYSIKKAKDVLDEVIKSHPKSEGGINAQNLSNNILRPEMSLVTEKVNVPGLPFRTLVKYKNSTQIWFRILPLTKELKNMMRENDGSQKVFAKMVSGNNIRNWQQSLPKTDDYLQHSVEVKIDALPVGEYVLLGSGDANFSLDKTPIVAQYFYISDISFINSREEYFILNRTTGKPLANAKAQVWFQKYSYDTRENIMQKGPVLVANKNGYLKLPINEKSKDQQFVKLELSYLKDYLFLDDFQYTPYYEQQSKADEEYENQKEYDEESAKVFLFTDRSIYRPGQIVYFKGIGVTKDIKNEKSILLQSKDSLTVILTDANGQKTDSIKVKLNEFGSFNGKFKLPENKLNGEFNIEVSEYNNSSISFSVEEYKRPKFYTEFEKVKESYRVGDTVSITGFAKAYAGNNIDGALVKFSVTREARFLYPWMFWRKGFPRTSSLEITHGEITTDANGKFSIKFAAIPDLTLDESTDPVFDYKIKADVTDINGETRSGDITVPVGYKALNLQISMPANAVFEKDSLKNIPVSSTNLSDESIAAKANLKIYKLESPDRLIRKRFWDEPDQFIYSKEEYIRNFPHDEYKDESQKESWAKGKMVFEKTDSVSKKSSFDIQASNLAEGWYVAEIIAKDQYGKEVRDKKYFQVFDKKSATLPAQQYIWNYAEKTFVEPGDKAKFIQGSSASDLFVIEQIDRKGLRDGITPASTFNYVSLNKNKKAFELAVTEDDRGGFSVNHFFVKDNRFYVSSNPIYVPWSNKDLTISFDTYRDKTLPGSEEKWKVSIKGNKGDKVAAEMLASMYDASLDQFQPHSWQSLNSIWPTYYSPTNWIDRQNFTTVNSIEKYWSEKYIQQKEKRYDALNYLPGYYYGGFSDKNIVIRGSGIVSQEMAAPGMMRKENLSEAVIVTALSGKVAGVQITDSALGLFPADQKPTQKVDQSQIQIRKNFNETAFFFPELRTDKDGNIEFSFTMPEALTQWKLMTLAHTKDLASGYAERTVITQKELMVQPNAPRFLREGDQVEFSAKIVNMGDKEVTGQAELQLLNASTMSPVDGWFKNIIPVQYFTTAAGQSTLVNFSIEVPTNFNNAVVYRIVAKAGNVSDGEEAPIPVVTNRMLVTESLPLNMKGDGSKNFSFEKLINSNNSKTLTNYGLTIEYTTNPVWTVVQSLPYLMEYPYECSEQSFNRFYANALAQKIVNSSPKIKMVFDKWKVTDTAALMSNLQKNEELKSVLLQETPWVLNAQNEQEQKKNIALLFDMVKMSEQMA
ncbi:MAG: MG2 domain-containing protein, partial [Ginsengibacter sp.]